MGKIMSSSLEPAGLAGVSLEGLAAAGEVKMLAAVAKLGGQPVAVSALDVLAALPDAFGWWWAAVREYPESSVAEWNSAARLPAGVLVPDEFVDEVSVFVVQPGSPHDPRAGARIALFKALAAGAIAIGIARRILVASAPSELELHAAELLGGSDPGDRATVVNAAVRGGRPKVALLAALQPPLSANETDVIQGALDVVLGNLDSSEQPFAVQLLSRLPAAQGTSLLVRNSAAHGAVVNPLVSQLGARVREWLPRLPLEDQASAVLARLLIAQIGSIPDHEERLSTAEWILQRHPAETLDSYIGLLQAEAGSRARPEEARADLRRLLVASPSDLLVGATAAVATLADILRWNFDRSDEANVAFGQAFAGPIEDGRLPADAVADSIADAIQFRGSGAVVMIRGLASALDAVPGRLADVAVGTPEGFAQLVLARDLQGAIEAQRRSGADTGKFVRALVATSVALRHEAIDGAGVFGGLLDQLEPARLSEHDVVALANELRHRPMILRNLLWRLMRTLRGPESARAPAAVLRHVMMTVDDLEQFANWPINETVGDDDLVQALTQHPDPEVRSLTATWLGEAPPTPASRRIAIDAAASAAASDNPFRAACAKIAGTLATIAADIARPDRDRVAALRGANQSDPAIGRAAALSLGSSTSVEIRYTAAKVLAERSGRGEDLKVLEEWSDREHNVEVKSELATAVRRLKSGDVGDALHNLLAYFGLSSAFEQLDARHAVPASNWNSTFIELVDPVRASATASVKDAVQAHVLLADLLVDLAVATHWLGQANPKLQAQGQQILDNDAKKLTSGNLIHNQQLIRELPWLHTFAALRQQRNAHPKPGRRSQAIGDDVLRRQAHDQTRIVVEGWAQVMLDAEG
ncbi:hypothetical protein [Kribbella sp. NPDC048928]|uniref:hypothetical protein n=1 Tax=Kribbella sp. NPDC048928 TaxID=3364111 RepID=UPI00372336F1